MNHDFHLPAMAPFVPSARIAEVLVLVGEDVHVDQPAFEVVAGAERFTLPCHRRGTVTAIHTESGREVAVGDLLLTIYERDAPGANRSSLRGPCDTIAYGGCCLQVLAAILLVASVLLLLQYGPSFVWLLLFTMLVGLLYLGQLGRFAARMLDAILLAYEEHDPNRVDSDSDEEG